MHGAGALVMAVDSRVIALHRHDSFAALLNATLWNADVLLQFLCLTNAAEMKH